MTVHRQGLRRHKLANLPMESRPPVPPCPDNWSWEFALQRGQSFFFFLAGLAHRHEPHHRPMVVIAPTSLIIAGSAGGLESPPMRHPRFSVRPTILPV
jgi:hypothetical protein